MKTELTAHKVGDRVIINKWVFDTYGTIKEIKGKRLGVLEDSTTTGAITYFSLRKDNTFVEVGYSLFNGAYIKNTSPIKFITRDR